MNHISSFSKEGFLSLGKRELDFAKLGGLSANNAMWDHLFV